MKRIEKLFDVGAFIFRWFDKQKRTNKSLDLFIVGKYVYSQT